MFIYKENYLTREADFFFIAEGFEGGSSSYTRHLSKRENIVLPEENVAQVSGKHEYQVSFI